MPATWGKNTLTNQALTMMNQALGISAITFTKAVTITDDITGDSVSQLQALTSVNYKQSRTPKAIATQDNKSRLGVTIDNSDVNEDYTYYGVGLYAKQNSTNQEVLFSVIPLTAGATMIAKENNATTASIYLDLYTDIVRGTQVTIMVSNSGTLSREDVQQMISQSIGNALNYPNETASIGTDFNAILDISITRIINDTTVVNAPSGFSGTGYLTTIGSGDKTVPIMQTLDDTINNIRSTRYFNSTTNVWSEWNAYAKTIDVNQQLDKKVNVSDMRKPANDVAGIEETVLDNHDGSIKANGTSYDLSKSGLTSLQLISSGSFNDLPLGTVFTSNRVTEGPDIIHTFTTTTFYSPQYNGRKAQIAIADSANLMFFRTFTSDLGGWKSWTNLTTDTSSWQKQALFNPGSYMIASTIASGLNFYDLLTKKYTAAGVYYIRDDYKTSIIIDSVVISEGDTWWYAYGVSNYGNFYYRKINSANDTGWVANADDSKVAHLSGANNFDTVPTVNNNPLLLASSLPSDLARTSQQTNFTAGLQSNGQDVLTVKTPGVPKLAVKYNATSKAFDYTLTAPEKDGFSDIIQYNLLWKDHSVDDWTTVIVKPDDLTGQLTGVDIPKTYDFKAAAQNAVGSSDYTDVVTLGTVDGNIYGVSWDGSSSGALQRTDAAVGLKAGINGAQNDFDTRGPWGLMDKTVTDSYGNAFVRVPKFYIRKTQNKPLSTWQISLVKQGDDWYLPNCFYDFDNKKELDYVDVSRYEGSIASGKLQSKTGATPTTNQTIVQLRSSAVANNTDGKKGYHLWDVHTLDALQVLFTIEFATLDSQSIMEGNTDNTGNSLANNGATDNVKGSSGFVTSGATPMTYRGIENLYGNLAMWTDGLNINSLSLYSCDDATKYASDVFTSPYYKVSYPLTSSTNGNITGLGFDKNHPGVTAPISSNSDSYNTYYHDYGYANGSGNYAVYTGGGWNWAAGSSGLWSWYGGHSSSGADSDVGSRLLKKAL